MPTDRPIFKHLANLRGKGVLLLLAALGILLLIAFATVMKSPAFAA